VVRHDRVEQKLKVILVLCSQPVDVWRRGDAAADDLQRRGTWPAPPAAAWGLHALRMPPLGVMLYMLVGPVSMMLAGAFAFIWLTYRPSTLADMLPISGTVAEYGYNDLDRFLIVLEEYNSFIAHAEIETFDAQQFTREVQPGDQISFMIHNDRQNEN
jgi:hypothetical protein